jgi:hypothetical protein
MDQRLSPEQKRTRAARTAAIRGLVNEHLVSQGDAPISVPAFEFGGWLVDYAIPIPDALRRRASDIEIRPELLADARTSVALRSRIIKVVEGLSVTPTRR